MAIPRLFALVLVVFLVAAATPSAAETPNRDKPRLRIVNAQLRSVVQEGLQHSPSFRALAERLETTDVVVYAEATRLPARLAGQLAFVSKVGGLRYVVVQIDRELSPIRKLATLGHELQHALEIAERPSIVDAASMKKEFARFGFSRERSATYQSAFDTAAAIHAGDQVWREISGNAANMD